MDDAVSGHLRHHAKLLRDRRGRVVSVRVRPRGFVDEHFDASLDRFKRDASIPVRVPENADVRGVVHEGLDECAVQRNRCVQGKSR